MMEELRKKVKSLNLDTHTQIKIVDGWRVYYDKYRFKIKIYGGRCSANVMFEISKFSTKGRGTSVFYAKTESDVLGILNILNTRHSDLVVKHSGGEWDGYPKEVLYISVYGVDDTFAVAAKDAMLNDQCIVREKLFYSKYRYKVEFRSHRWDMPAQLAKQSFISENIESMWVRDRNTVFIAEDGYNTLRTDLGILKLSGEVPFEITRVVLPSELKQG
jgi:hypothetical protein